MVLLATRLLLTKVVHEEGFGLWERSVVKLHRTELMTTELIATNGQR